MKKGIKVKKRALNEQREQEYIVAQIELAESNEQAIADLPSYSYLTDEEYVQFTEAINGAEYRVIDSQAGPIFMR